MATVWKPFYLTANGAAVTGHSSFTLLHLKRMDDQTDIDTGEVTIVEQGHGMYVAGLDPEINGEATSVIDAGASFTDISERYIPISWALDSSVLIMSREPGGVIEADAAVDATDIALPVALNVAEGMGLFVWKGSGAPHMYPIASYNPATGAAVLAVPLVAALNGTSSDPDVRSRFMLVPAMVPAVLPAVDENGLVQLDPTTSIDDVTEILNRIGVPAVSLADDLSDPSSIAEAVWDDVDGAAVAAAVAAIEADTQDIQGRLPAALVNGRLVVDLRAIAGRTDIDGTTLDNWAAYVQAVLVGPVVDKDASGREFQNPAGTVVRVASDDGRESVTLTPLA